MPAPRKAVDVADPRMALAQMSAAELIELLELGALHDELAGIRRLLTTINHRQEQIMTALEDLQSADADLAAAVTDLSSSVDRIDTDFTALEQKLGTGVSADDVQAEVSKLRATIDAAKQAKANLDSTDPAQPAPSPDQPTA